MRESGAFRSQTLVAAIALIGAAVMGAGVTAVFAAPAAAPVAAPSVVQAKPIAVTRPATLAPRPAPAAPTVSNLKATFVSAAPDSVTVEGVGTISGTPDVLLVGLQVTVQRDTTDEALNGANAVVDQLVSSLTAHGVAAADIQTTGLSLSPTYDYDNDKQTKTGYAAGQSLSVKLRSAQRRGATISAASAVSADITITGLSFDLENNTALLARAQRASFAMAKDEAARYAGLAGRSLGRVLAINQVTNSPTATPYPFGGGALAAAPAASGSVPISAGSQPVSVSVIVTWALR